MDSPLQLNLNDKVYRRLNKSHWKNVNGKDIAFLEGFTIKREKEKELSLYIAHLQTPRGVFQQNIDMLNTTINNPALTEAEKARSRSFLKGKETVEAFIDKGFRIAEIEFAAFVGKDCKYYIDLDPTNKGHFEVSFPEAYDYTYPLEFANQARILSIDECLEIKNLPFSQIDIRQILLPAGFESYDGSL